MTDTLLMVFTIFRHGDRAPLTLDENHPYAHLFPDGAGALTKEGQVQAYELGLKFRRQFKNLISADYKADEIYVYSTDSDRCLMTAQCCLAGLFPPQEQRKWHPELNWQPIPVHTRNGEEDPLAMRAVKMRLDELYNETAAQLHPDWYQNYIEKKTEWVKWQKWACIGDQPSVHQTLIKLDTVLIMMKKNLKYEIPSDLNILALASSVLETLFLFTETHPYFVKQGYELLTQVLDRMKGIIDGSRKTKLYLYSLHDLNICSVSGQLGLNLQRTSYCGDLRFELHKLTDGKHYVRIQHCLNYTDEPFDVCLDQNNAFCPIEKFEELVKASQLRARI
ncbi:hypothetical protein CHUAL_006453 [Chamberlinius hualienensis]